MSCGPKSTVRQTPANPTVALLDRLADAVSSPGGVLRRAKTRSSTTAGGAGGEAVPEPRGSEEIRILQWCFPGASPVRPRPCARAKVLSIEREGLKAAAPKFSERGEVPVEHELLRHMLLSLLVEPRPT